MTGSTPPSWNDGNAKAAVLHFIGRTTTDGPGFVPPADRIAAFDNDGTLWVEQPMPPQFDFVFGHWAEEMQRDPSLAEQQPYKALLDKDPAFLQGVAAQDPTTIDALLGAFGRSWAGSSPEEFESQVRAWLQTARQPALGVLYADLVYKPMLELLDLLKANEFRVFVCSGGGRDFMRVFAEETWGIYKENVIGTAAEYTYTDRGMVRGDHALGSLDVGPGKPEHLFAQTGRLPLLAGGNADVDIEMLSAATFSLIVNHDDGEREIAYTSGADAAFAKARERGWTVISMKDDWNTVF
jgi:phosphoglycolate phosphatase-like HAD superfamily hydrolase